MSDLPVCRKCLDGDATTMTSLGSRYQICVSARSDIFCVTEDRDAIGTKSKAKKCITLLYVLTLLTPRNTPNLRTTLPRISSRQLRFWGRGGVDEVVCS